MLRSLTQKDQIATLYLPNFIGRTLIMRKLLILQSLSHGKGMPVSYHKESVRLAEGMIALNVQRLRGVR